MLENDYGDYIDGWKVDLIRDRARCLGLPEHDVPDAQQEIVEELFNFQFDPARSNGATEKTAVTAVVDRQLRNILRAKRRYRRHAGQTMTDSGIDEYTLVDPRSSEQEAIALRMDVRQAVADLPDFDRQICIALGAGWSIAKIAKRLQSRWHTVKHRIAQIRTHFEDLGLDGWIIEK